MYDVCFHALKKKREFFLMNKLNFGLRSIFPPVFFFFKKASILESEKKNIAFSSKFFP